MNDYIEDSSISAELIESIDVLIEAISLDPVAIGKLIKLLSDKTFTAVQKIPYLQLKRYIDGVSKVELSLGDRCKLSEKLFSNPRKRNENAMRIYKMVTLSETEKKIDYLVDATRSMLLELIDVDMMFRVFRAIAETLPEDMDYLAGLIEKDGPFKGNIQVHALVRAGLMISAGIDAEEDVEKQEYYISSLGYIVDQFALSANNQDRGDWYKKNQPTETRIFQGPRAASEEEITALFDDVFKEQSDDIIEAAKPKWETFSKD